MAQRIQPHRCRARVRLGPGVTADPHICGGKPVIEGTRVAVSIIVGALAGGDTIEVVCEEYGLTEKQVRDALAYAADTVAEEQVVAVPA